MVSGQGSRTTRHSPQVTDKGGSMSSSDLVRDALEKHLQAILDNDIDTYHTTTVPDLALYD